MVIFFIDQKYNEGVEADFFARPAMTSPAFVELAPRYRCPLLPVRMERLEGARFRMTVYEPLDVINSDGTPKDIRACIDAAHAMLQNWITDKPGQWIWLHRRWKNQEQETDPEHDDD